MCCPSDRFPCSFTTLAPDVLPLRRRAMLQTMVVPPQGIADPDFQALPALRTRLLLLCVTTLALWSAACSSAAPHAGHTRAKPTRSTEEEPQRVLILVSNVADMGDPEAHEAKNNLWEVAPPFHVFRSHGLEVVFASPRGGAVPFSMDPVGISSYAIRYEGFLDAANASLKTEAVDPAAFDAVFIGGGAGPLFDVASDAHAQRIIAAVYERGGVVGACGHGPGSLTEVRLTSGQYLVKGRRIAGFPDATEREKPWAKGGTLLPFLVEERLRARGASFQGKAELADKHDVVIDERIVTTMFLPSAALVAEEMSRLLRARALGNAPR